VILLNRRDNFIANRIEQTLKAEEKAILFIGAFHNIKKRLPKDIQIKEVKDAAKVKRYQKLLPFYNKNGKQFDELGKYLVSDVV
jgi:pheromone shutdown protein TraB